MENREENKERESGKRTDGLVHIYCGDGKGKTTASVGAAVRAAGSGKKVVIKRFLKNDHSGEVEVLKQIPGITVLPCTRQFGFSWKMSSQEKEEAKEYYGEELEKAWKTAWGQDADMLIILTAVEKVAVNFGKENEEWLDDLTVSQARKYIEEGQFAAGSMLPKVQACVDFASSGTGRTAMITLLEKAKDGIMGKTGTQIHL